jgi:voltage-gated potassium channel
LGAGLITEISRLLRVRRFPAGRSVMRRGEAGHSMFFIADGELEVELPDRRVRLQAGSFVGELALITGAPRMATVVTTQPSTLLVLEVAEFRELAASRPELLRALEEEAARRRGEGAVMPTDGRSTI